MQPWDQVNFKFNEDILRTFGSAFIKKDNSREG